MRIFLNNRGQSLLEAIFAIGLLLIAVSAVLGLAIANSAGQSASELQLVANNLAREGIEVVRNVRDSNWLASQSWDTGLIGDGTAIPNFDKNTNTWTLDFAFNQPTTVYLSGGVYNHTSSGQATIYRRLLTLRNVCIETSGANIGTESVAAGISCTVGTKVGIKVESMVNWVERGRDHSVTLASLIYAWKK